MVPLTLSQPPETTIAISLFGVELIRIMAKESERCCNIPGNANVDSLKDSPVTALHWLIFIHPQQACISPTNQNISKYILHMPRSEVGVDVEQ